tara:strand:- start:1229 stop:1606 length:378 start_codon:yes stop_codon:yes gene_type:complete
MSTSDTTDTLKKKLLQALEKSLGVVTTACKSAGVSRDTHYRWMKEDDDYRAGVDDLGNVALDFAESKLHEQIMEGNVASVIFFLKCKGKVRGYVERQEIKLDKTTPDLSDLSTSQLIDLLDDNDK